MYSNNVNQASLYAQSEIICCAALYMPQLSESCKVSHICLLRISRGAYAYLGVSQRAALRLEVACRPREAQRSWRRSVIGC